MEKEIRFDEPEKPEIEELIKVISNTEEFCEPEKAESIIQHLGLKVGDDIKENGDYYEINPRMELEGNSPEQYQKAIDNLKKILTPSEIKDITKAMKRRTKDYDGKLYYKIKERFNKFFKNFEPKKNLKKELIEALNFDKEINMGGIYNMIYHLLSKDKSDYIICYKCAWNNKPVPNIQTWNERNDGEYKILTDSEADYQARQYLEDDDYLWKQSVESGNTQLGFDDWVEWVINMDGRASLLNGYDGSEEYEDVNDTTYYIYRNN